MVLYEDKGLLINLFPIHALYLKVVWEGKVESTFAKMNLDHLNDHLRD
jgi:hypothetical protein